MAEMRASLRAVARHPELWGATAVTAARHVPRRWWQGPRAVRRAEPWLRFRLETAYGDERPTPTPDDAVTYLRWCRAWPRARR